MKKVLVPVDYSDTSLNAARYAAQLFTGVYGVHLLLYHMYEKPEHAATAEKELNRIMLQLKDVAIVKIETLCEQGHDLLQNITRYATENQVDLVVMGSRGSNPASRHAIGSNTWKLASADRCPVLIVPPKAVFTQLKNLAFASIFTGLPAPSGLQTLRELLMAHYGTLHIINVNPEHHITVTAPYEEMHAKFEDAFRGFSHTFHFMNQYELEEAMQLFITHHQVDLIITQPGEHSWLERFVGSSHTDKIAYHSRIPVLAIH